MSNLFTDKKSKQLIKVAGALFLFAVVCDVYAANLTIGTMASSITSSFTSIAKLITGGSYIAGLGFSIGAIMKFKQHKDNPTQIPIGTPIALMFIAAALLFLPTILAMTGSTMFGASGGKTASPSGMIFGS